MESSGLEKLEAPDGAADQETNLKASDPKSDITMTLYSQPVRPTGSVQIRSSWKTGQPISRNYTDKFGCQVWNRVHMLALAEALQQVFSRTDYHCNTHGI